MVPGRQFGLIALTLPALTIVAVVAVVGAASRIPCGWGHPSEVMRAGFRKSKRSPKRSPKTSPWDGSARIGDLFGGAFASIRGRQRGLRNRLKAKRGGSGPKGEDEARMPAAILHARNACFYRLKRISGGSGEDGEDLLNQREGFGFETINDGAFQIVLSGQRPESSSPSSPHQFEPGKRGKS